ncbi:MAG TPA: ABC transporter permease subunit [Spirochaetia bacterium]|nr:ABC transporter permease subunit [Spirochaetia bacterium]
MSRPEHIPLRKATRGSRTTNLTLLVLGLSTIVGLIFLDGRDVRVFVTHRRTAVPTVTAGTASERSAAAEAARKKNREISFLQASAATLKDLGTMFFHPHADAGHFSYDEHMERLIGSGGGFLNSTFSRAVYGVFITLGLGFLTTLIGAIVALVLGLLASRNLSSQRASTLIKGLVAFIRAVPTVLWVLIFAIGAGLGSVAAIIGMSFHSIGYLIKAYSESFEEIDVGVIEALKASGANWLQIVFQAVLPSTMGYLVSWTFVRFEINFTTAVAMGAAAGAGGIGYNLFMASYYLNIREMGYITYLILAVAVLMEIAATRLKKRYRLHE